ncbi:hypothetical protein KJ751_01040 [Patescibacteria group bacterium]|nr:hypothetical protein [Patescibacteria group bacterium]
MEQPKKWPEGTKIIKNPEGKREIILPQPTNMSKFNLAERKRTKTPEDKSKIDSLQISQQGGTLGTPESNLELQEKKTWFCKSPKKTHPRQEQIKKGRGKERKLVEEMKNGTRVSYPNVGERLRKNQNE